jgi:type I restriction enzyme S subunit
VIASTVRTYLKAIAPVVAPPANLIVSTGFAVIRPRNGLDSHFAKFSLQSGYFVDEVISRSTGVSYPAINASEMAAISLTIPPLPEQHQIASFLDRECGKLDALQAKQERLIELLKEKRQALISHAVTRGLDPTAKLKPSGIEWLGDVPEHWSVVPLDYHFTIQLGKMLDSNKITGKHLRPYLRVFDVQWGKINTEDLPLMDFDEDAREKFRLQIGDLLVNEGGSYPGRSAVWIGEIGECYYQKALHRIRPRRPFKSSTDFLFYIMCWATGYGVFAAGGNEATIEHLPAEKLRKYRFPLPPLPEQRAIFAHLDEKCGKIDQLKARAERGIELLKERRSALISAAVTGKIDVRNQS